jgi:hypothetical protein
MQTGVNFMKRKIPSFIIALCLMLSCAAPALAAEFTDVKGDHPHKDAIDFCTKNEFMVGKGGGLFGPDDPITRMQFCQVWAKTFHARRHSFTDVPRISNDADNAIILMHGLRYFSGVSPNEFARTPSITREQVAQVVYNTYLKGISSDEEYKNFTDYAQIAGWARHAVSVCYQKGIFTNIAGAEFKPKQHITRAEVCAVLMRLLKKEVTKEEPPVEPETPETYTVTIAPMENGTVTADKDEAGEGETVTLTIEPGYGYKLVEGSLKYNGEEISGTTFDMPDKNVTITAEFELI